MKVLFLTTGKVDYQCDALFHGLYSVLGKDITHNSDYHIMYRNFLSDNEKLNLYGKGFTIWGLLPNYFNDNSDIELKIKKRYFDFIIYGSIRRCTDYLDLVLDNYPKNKIAFIDGEDDPYLYTPIDNVPYFKRELMFDTSRVFPISFAIPKEKICDNSQISKIKVLADFRPNSTYTYVYDNEEDYYNGYRESYYGLTHKKAGWDCMRHYEILANYCLPYFPDLAQCPRTIMTNFPKKLVISATGLADCQYIDDNQYYDYLNEAFKYTKEFLTTYELGKYVLSTMIRLS